MVSGGVYDIGVGVPDLEPAIEYWRAFGYEPGERGRLSDDAAARLYGIHSPVEVVRLFHQRARQGLVRLMRWECPRGAGLSMAPLRSIGTRWSVHRTDDLLMVYTHAEALRRRGAAIALRGPVLHLRRTAGTRLPRPFHEPLLASYNLQIFQPYAQQVIKQRQNIDMSSYGNVNPVALLRCSEACHVALVALADEAGITEFYERIFGLVRTTELRLGFDPDSVATVMFDLQPGESLVEIDLDDPTAPDVASAPRPGRLRLFLLEPAASLPDVTDRAGPGHLGYSLYSYRTTMIEEFRSRVAAAVREPPTPLLEDEFGRRSFTFRSPDRYFWQIIEDDG